MSEGILLIKAYSPPVSEGFTLDASIDCESRVIP